MMGEREQDSKAASEIAQEVVRRYLPYESPDAGRGRRCVEYIESTVAADRATARAETWNEAIEVASQYGAARKHAWNDPSNLSIVDALKSAKEGKR